MSRLTGTLTVAAISLAVLGAASAQLLPPQGVPGGPPPGVQDRRPLFGPSDRGLCARLEAALSQIDAGAGGSDPDTVRRYEDAIARQRYELDQTIMQGRRLGCDSGGFFLFGRQRPPQCDQVTDQIGRMRANLDRMRYELGNLRGGTDLNRDLQRRQLISQLEQNDCGPQYRRAAAPQPPRARSLLEALFGGGWRDDSTSESGPFELPLGGGYRTVCVRTCDGYFFPISFATTPARFAEDEHSCRRLCPNAEVRLFTHRNPGEEIEQAVGLDGTYYTQMPNAFKYRQAYDPKCSCRAPGQSWAEALGVRDETLQQGDIVVTEERARQMAQPKAAGGPKGQRFEPAPPAQSGRFEPALLPKAMGPVEEPPPAVVTAPGERKVRTVGPPFYSAR